MTFAEMVEVSDGVIELDAVFRVRGWVRVSVYTSRDSFETAACTLISMN
jgi:hypothetical protein